VYFYAIVIILLTMSLTPKENNLPLSKFESMLKTNSIYFFDSVEFEEIIHYYIDSGKNALSKKAIHLALKQHPYSVDLKLLQAEVLIFDEELKKAATLLKEIQVIEPSNAEIYVQQASISSKNNNHKKAIYFLEIALEYTDDAVDILSIIGMEYLFLDNFDKALLHFSKCLDVAIEDYSSLYNVIYCFDMQNKHKEAIKYLNTYINKNPYSEIAWHQLGKQYAILKRNKEALIAFDYAVVIDEYFVGGYLEKAKILEQQKKYKEAIENYKITIELEDPTSFALLRIGKCYHKLNKIALAILFYKKALHEDPLLDKGWFAITNLYFKEEKYEKALYYINRAIEIDAQNTLYWKKYAQINLKLHFLEEVAIAFEHCILLHEVAIEIWIGLSDTLCFLGKYEEALLNLIKATSYFKDFTEIEYRLSGLYYTLNNFQKGEKHLNKALSINFKHHSILKELFPKVYATKEVQKMLKKSQ